MVMTKTNITITLPEQLISRIDEEVTKNGYSSREELVLFVLRYYFDKNGKIDWEECTLRTWLNSTFLNAAFTEAEQEGARHVELKLAPEHLGKLSVELTQGKDGVLHIVFHAENEQAMKLLQEHSATLVSMLHGSHSGEIQVEVPRPQQGEQPWQQPEQQPGQQHGRNPQEQGRQRQSTEDFLQQLRLGLLGVEAE